MHAARQGRDGEPGRQREGPRRDRDDRRRRARRAAAARRHDRRADVGQHRRRPRDRRRAARLPLHLRDERQDERREGRAAARVRRRGRRVPDRGAARGPALVLLDRRAPRARDAGRVPARPVLQPGQPARARADDRSRDLASRPRAGSRTSSPASAPAARSPASAATSRRRTPTVQIVGADPVGLGVLGRHRPPVSRRGRRRGLLADHVRPVARRPRRRGQRRRLVPHRAARHARGRPAHRRLGRHRGARRARGRAAELGPDAVVVVLLPDSGRSYLSKIFDDQWMFDMGFLRGRRPGRRRRARGEGRRDARPRARSLPDEPVRDAITRACTTPACRSSSSSVTKELPLAAKEVVGHAARARADGPGVPRPGGARPADRRGHGARRCR